MRACALYHQHGKPWPSSYATGLTQIWADFGEAEKQFQGILTLDPHRIDNIDIYSDILYVTDNRIKLSKLAHEFLEIDKDRPEVCCLVGETPGLTDVGATPVGSSVSPYYREPLFAEVRTRESHQVL